MKHKIRIGTRGSRLALWQAEHVQRELEKTGVTTEIVVIKTRGDLEQNLSLQKLEGKGFFTREIEQALLEERIDLAVHSMKDLPTTPPEGLVISAVSYREDPADWLLIRRESVREGKPLKLGSGARVGTSSNRRKAQLFDLRPDLELVDIRGNVPTRLRKLAEGQFDAIVLAAAGLIRLGIVLADFEVLPLNPREFVPAPAQGVLAMQTRIEDHETRKALLPLHHAEVAAVTNVERTILHLLEGGCHLPLGVYCERDPHGNFHVWTALAEAWNQPLRRLQHSSSTSYKLAETIVKRLRTASQPTKS